jgi:[acyl-carrier-protein] S-malonyltransferase
VVKPQPFALLFPGQGAQSVGMGKGLAEAFPAARACFEEADSLLGYSLSKLCWEGPVEELTRTEHCQPALYVTSLAALAALESECQRGQTPRGLTPSAAAGLSLGEYTALAAAGALSFADGLKLVRLRGQAMEEAARAKPGTMASVLGLELEQLQEVCAETGAQVANLNSPGQVVISGTAESVTAASAKAKEKGAKRVIPLEVGGAFHSRLMAPAAARLAEALKNLPVQAPRYPVASNVTGAYHEEAGQIGPLLVRQLTEPVQWVGCVRTMAEKGIKIYIEVGPGTVLKGLVRKINPEATVHSAGTAEEMRQLAAAWPA